MTEPLRAKTVGQAIQEAVRAVREAQAQIKATSSASAPSSGQVCAPPAKADTFERHPNGVPVLRPVLGDRLKPLLAGITADLAEKQLKAGDYEGAKASAAKLTKCPTRDYPIDLSKTQVDPMVDTPGGGRTMIDRSRFKTTMGELGDKKIAQAEQLAEMERVCGKKVDPHNVDQVREYFQKYSDAHPGKAGVGEVRDEYAKYCKNFMVHPGGGTQYSQDIPMDQRPARMNEILANQPTDAAGRKMIDCKGYGMLTQSILGGIKDGNKPRFDVVHAGNEKHVVAGVFDRKTGEAFVMNNDRADPVETRLIRENPARADELRVRVMKHWEAPRDAAEDSTRPREPMSVAGRSPSDAIHPAAKPYVQ
jgi:hypothetical protein